MDEAGNVRDCLKDVKIEMFSDEKPYCARVSGNYTYVKRDGSTKHTVECYVYKGESSGFDKSKLTLNNSKLGTVSAAKSTNLNSNKNNKVIVDINFKVNNSGDGTENIILSPGFVKNDTYVNDAITVQEDNFYVDTTLPKISFSTNKSIESGGWYAAPVKITTTCTDSGSGVKQIKQGTLTGASSITVNRTTAANPVTYSPSCTDKAGNSNNASKNYYVKINSRNSTCGCETYKKCRTSACGCETRNRCSACGCASTKYCSKTTYSWGSWYSNSGTPNYSKVVSSCSSGTVGKYAIKSLTCIRCTRSIGGDPATGCKTPKNNSCAEWKWKQRKCNSSSSSYACGCNYYARCSSCSCNTYYSCRASSCGCDTYKSCWHY